MAQRRMFSLKIVDTDLFLDMPASTQNLYFHLSMRADDDGFISSPKKIMKIVGCSEDDMKVLIAKNFVIPFASGICVIKHWRIHNYIQKDRYIETMYKEEKAQLESIDNQYIIEEDTKCIQNGDTGKVRDRVELEINTEPEKDDLLVFFEKLWKFYGRLGNKQTALQRFKKLSVKQREEVRANVRRYVENTNTDGTYPSRKHLSTYLNKDKEYWNDEVVVTGSKDEPVAKPKNSGIFANI